MRKLLQYRTEDNEYVKIVSGISHRRGISMWHKSGPTTLKMDIDREEGRNSQEPVTEVFINGDLTERYTDRTHRLIRKNLDNFLENISKTAKARASADELITNINQLIRIYEERDERVVSSEEIDKETGLYIFYS